MHYLVLIDFIWVNIIIIVILIILYKILFLVIQNLCKVSNIYLLYFFVLFILIYYSCLNFDISFAEDIINNNDNLKKNPEDEKMSWTEFFHRGMMVTFWICWVISFFIIHKKK